MEKRFINSNNVNDSILKIVNDFVSLYLKEFEGLLDLNPNQSYGEYEDI